MAAKKLTKKRERVADRQVFHLAQARGKIINDATVSVSSGYTRVELSFRDGTALGLRLETQVVIFPELADWTTGDVKMLKRWRPVTSKF